MLADCPCLVTQSHTSCRVNPCLFVFKLTVTVAVLCQPLRLLGWGVPRQLLSHGLRKALLSEGAAVGAVLLVVDICSHPGGSSL